MSEPKYNDENYQPDPFPEDVARPDVAPTIQRPRHMRTYQSLLGQTLEGAVCAALIIAREYEEVALIHMGASCVVTDEMSHQFACSLMKASMATQRAYQRMICEGRDR